jgi:DNA ligase-1
MLAGSLDPGQLPKFPCVMSPKLDGVRLVVIDGVALTRNLKPIRNTYTQNLFGRMELNGLDGELIVGDATHPKCYRNTVSGVMAYDGQPNVLFHVFDDFSNPGVAFIHRYKKMIQRLKTTCNKIRPLKDRVHPVWHEHVNDEVGLQRLEEDWLERGYEGAMIRDPFGTYKFGRSSVREGKLVKLKRFMDAEARIIGFEEFMHNGNEATRNALGQLERSSAKAGKQGMQMLGALVVKTEDGVEFKIGAGFTTTERMNLWKVRSGLIGLHVKYKYFPTGSKDRPRFPVFLGFRDEDDR